MFDIFNSKSKVNENHENDYLRPMDQMLSFIKISQNYQSEIGKGNIKFPIHLYSHDFSFLEVWIGTRIEWVSYLWLENNPTNLADNDKYDFQLDVINSLKKDAFYKRNNLPNNTNLEKNIKSISELYGLISDQCVNQTVMIDDQLMIPKEFIIDKERIKFSAYSEIFNSIDLESKKIKSFLSQPNFNFPKTLFEILYEDITRLSKLLSLTVIFGHDYTENQKKLLLESEKRNIPRKELIKMRIMMDLFNKAEDPDEIETVTF